jgi:hypothetical protein
MIFSPVTFFIPKTAFVKKKQLSHITGGCLFELAYLVEDCDL